jgi:hypothetical protein
VVLPEAKAIGSVAMSLLGGDEAPGVMLFSSRDAQHYQQGQGTQLLQEIASMLPACWSAGLNAHDRLSAVSAVDRFLRYLGVERQLSPITLLNYQRQLER